MYGRSNGGNTALTARTEFEFVARDDVDISKHLMEKFAGQAITEAVLEAIILEVLDWTASKVPALARAIEN